MYTLHYVTLHYVIRYITSNSLYVHNIDTQWHTHTYVCVYMYNCLNIIEHVSSNKSQQIILCNFWYFGAFGATNIRNGWFVILATGQHLTWISRRGNLCQKWVILRVGSDSSCGIIIYNIYITHHERNIIWCTVRLMKHH